MSNFSCEKCGTVMIDTPGKGYITECVHYPKIEKCGVMIHTRLHGGLWCANPKPCKTHSEEKGFTPEKPIEIHKIGNSDSSSTPEKPRCSKCNNPFLPHHKIITTKDVGGFYHTNCKPSPPEKKCDDCYAHYTGDHTCDGLMKGLVDMNKEKEDWREAFKEKFGTYDLTMETSYAGKEYKSIDYVIDFISQLLSDEREKAKHRGYEDGLGDAVLRVEEARADERRRIYNRVNNFMSYVEKDVPRIHPFHEGIILDIINRPDSDGTATDSPL